MDWTIAFLLEGFILFVLVPASIIVVAILAAMSGTLSDWWRSRSPFVDREQSPIVRKCALRLASRKRNERLLAVRLLGEMNDRSAVPVLIQALERYGSDSDLVELVIRSLARYGDPRSLPAIKRFVVGRNASLMLAAREAVASMEPQATLLRSAEVEIAAPSTLLRPVRTTRQQARDTSLRSADRTIVTGC